MLDRRLPPRKRASYGFVDRFSMSSGERKVADVSCFGNCAYNLGLQTAKSFNQL